MYDKDGKYAGINEYILDFKPIVDWYLKQTGQALVPAGVAVAGGYHQAAPAADATSGASNAGGHGAAPAAPAADATSGASA